MNARVEPPGLLRAPAPADDAALIRQCKLAIRAIERDLAAMRLRGDIDDAYCASLPPYPPLPRMLCETPGAIATPSRRYSAAQLRAIVRELGLKDMQAQITAVVAWEKESTALRKSSALAKAERLCATARARSLNCVLPVPGIAARTPEGASFKAMTLAFWLEANLALEDLGEEIVGSVVDDARRLGLAKAELPGRLPAAIQ